MKTKHVRHVNMNKHETKKKHVRHANKINLTVFFPYWQKQTETRISRN